MCRCLGDIIRKGGCSEGATGEVHFVTTPSLAPWHQFWRLFSTRLSFPCALEGFLCRFACWETAVGTGWSAAGDSRSATMYRGCLWLRGETTVWMCGRMERRGEGEGNGDGRRAAAFISWKLIPPFVHLSPHQIKWAGCGSDALSFSFFSTLLHPSIVMGLSWVGRKEASYWFGNEL